MNRISTNMGNYDMQFYTQKREFNLNEMENKIGTQSRIKNLRDDPMAASHAVRYESNLTRLNRYEQNVQSLQDTNKLTEDYLGQAVDVMQRIRELAIQGSNGTYSKEDLQKMGEEVNQLLGELVTIGNAKNTAGINLFGGTMTQGDAFRILHGNVPGNGAEVITGVQYIGNNEYNNVEVSNLATITDGYPGSEVFWAEQQQLFSGRNADTYVVQNDSVISIDGAKIELKAGENVHSIIAKINDSQAAVKAKLDPVTNSLVIETTVPHQLWLEDMDKGRVLKDLGIVSDNGSTPPNNLNSSARISGGSIFDMVMSLRNTLYEGRYFESGGQGLKGIDNSLDTLTRSMAESGSRSERMDFIAKRLNREIPDATEQLSKETDIDMAQAITELKMLEYTHRASLATAAKILPPTLLDFLR